MSEIKELPHDLLAEKSLLGCLLIDGESFDEISDLSLARDDFFHPQYGQIFDVIMELVHQSRPVDFVTVCGRLGDSGKIESLGGQSAILGLIEDQASSANVYHYAKTIKEKSTVRKIVKTAKKIMETGTSQSGIAVGDFLSEVESSFFKLTSEGKTTGLQRISTYFKMNLRDLENESRQAGQLSGLTTGFAELDKKLLGMQPGQFIVLAARPAMGKSALALNMAINSCKSQGFPVAIFSLEMLAQELSMRILSSEAKVDSTRIKSKSFLDQDLRNIGQAIKTVGQLPILINDSGDVTLFDIRSQCRKLKAEYGLGLVIIDYLQLMKSHSNNPSREQQISEISRGLKVLAKELECPVMGLSQLNRAVESRPNKRPMVSDLRESGSIEQDADVVLLIYRDEVYNADTKHKGIAEIIVGKNRSGETGTAYLSFVGATTSFGNLAYAPEPNYMPSAQ